jgi:serine/threonine-protein kinase
VLEHGEGIASRIGEVLDGKYRLDAFLSQGGMGAVYKATHVMLGRTVAVKLINPEYVTSTEAVRRFQREARAATSLNHPNIVSVFDLGQTPEGTLYIAMEFVNGPSLKSLIMSGGPVAPLRIIALLRQVANALAVAHRNNIVHRDLKPQNMMLTRSDDGREIVKLVDFGIAKTFDDATQLTTAGSAMGTPQYMSPEQAAGQPVDGRSDLYSLGVVMYEMLSGDVPFNDKSLTAIIIKHMKEIPQPPSVRNPAVKIPAPLEAAALRCLEKDPANRFQTAEEFVAALESAAAVIQGAAAAMQSTIAAGQRTIPADRATIPAKQATIPTSLPATPAAPRMDQPLEAPRPATVRVTADTRSTAVRPPVGGPSASGAPAVEKLVSRPSSNKGALVLLVAAILLAWAGAALYFVRQERTEPAPVAADSPMTTPAGAPAESTSPVPAGASSAAPASALPQTDTAPAPPAPARTTVGSDTTAPQSSSPAVSNAGRQTGPSSTVATTRTDATPAAPVTGRENTAASNAQAADAARQTVSQQFPENPAVYFHCTGAPEICAALRTAVDEALDGGGLSAVRNAARADIDVGATVEGVQQTVSQQFQTTFAVRTYGIEVSAETTRASEAVPMPPPSNLSFDPQFGSARIAERARLVAADIVERVKAFVQKKRGR